MISSNNLTRYRSGEYLTLGGMGVGMENILKKDFFSPFVYKYTF